MRISGLAVLAATSMVFGQGDFEVAVSLAPEGSPVDIVVGDFDADGELDLATAETLETAGHVSVWFADGEGGFFEDADFPAIALPPTSLYAWNLTPFDATDDLLVANGVDVVELFQSTDGVFGLLPIQQFVMPDVSTVVAFDTPCDMCDVDGCFQDLDSCEQQAGAGGVDMNDGIVGGDKDGDKLFSRVGDGSGGVPGNNMIIDHPDPQSIAAADLDMDGVSDVAIAQGATNTVRVQLYDCSIRTWGICWQGISMSFDDGDPVCCEGGGAGPFDLTNGVVAPVDVLIAPLDADTTGVFHDIAVLNANGTVKVFTNNGNFGGGAPFDDGSTFTVPADPVAFAAGDVDDDGHVDLAVAAGQTVTVYLNDGDAGFSVAATIDVGADARALVIAPLLDDAFGPEDIAVATATDVRIIRYAPIAPPTDLMAEAVSDSRIELSWTDNSTNETGFEIERSADGSPGTFSTVATVATDVTEYANTAVPAQTQLFYRVRATTASGGSDYTDVADATTPAIVCAGASYFNDFAPGVFDGLQTQATAGDPMTITSSTLGFFANNGMPGLSLTTLTDGDEAEITGLQFEEGLVELSGEIFLGTAGDRSMVGFGVRLNGSGLDWNGYVGYQVRFEPGADVPPEIDCSDPAAPCEVDKHNVLAIARVENGVIQDEILNPGTGAPLARSECWTSEITTCAQHLRLRAEGERLTLEAFYPEGGEPIGVCVEDATYATGFTGVVAQTGSSASRRFIHELELEARCAPLGDLDGSCAVDVLDLIALIGAWGPCPEPPDACPADLDLDGQVAVLDLVGLILAWGQTCDTQGPVCLTD